MQVRTTPKQELNRVLKDVKKYKRATDKEIKLLNMKIVKLQKLIEKNIIQEEEPTKDEIRAIKNFESKKNRMEFVSIDSLS